MLNSCSKRAVIICFSVVIACNLLIYVGWQKVGGLYFRQGQMMFSKEDPNITDIVQTSQHELKPQASTSESVKTTKTANAMTVNPHDYVYIHNPKNPCHENTELLIAVPVSRTNFPGRQTVRDTWGSYAHTKENKAALVFFLGSGSKNEQAGTQPQIDEEYEKFGDIVQESFIDSYRNLSLKSVSILKWAVTFCDKARFLVKADDDMYVNVPLLVVVLREMVEKRKSTNFVVGRMITSAKPIQNPNSKWYTPLKDFSEKMYPPYTSGTTYALTFDAASSLYNASLNLPLFWLEDIYITGLCRRKAGVEVVNEPKMTYDKPVATGCTYRNFITGHRYSRTEIRTIHQQLYDTTITCRR